MSESSDNEQPVVFVGIAVGSVIAIVLCAVFVLLGVLCVMSICGAIVREYQSIQQVTPVITNGPSREQLREWFDKNPEKAPPAEWYPKGDPWRGITAEEANKMLEDCEASE